MTAILASFCDLDRKVGRGLGGELRSRVGFDQHRQQEARRKALSTIANAGSPAAVLQECAARLGGGIESGTGASEGRAKWARRRGRT